MATDAPIVNHSLAELLAREPDPLEAVCEDQTHAMAWKVGETGDALLKRGRLALLACGHFAITKALHRAKCRRCGEMIRAGYDYDAFRNLGHEDDFFWPGDPLRPLHEKSEN